MNGPPPLPALVPELPNVQVGGALAVPTQPPEMCYPLRRDEFDLLCETETINEDKRWRDITLAIFVTAVIGLFGIVGSVDWDASFAAKHWMPLEMAVIVGVITIASLVVFVIQWIKVHQKPESSGYARVKVRITSHYEQYHG